MIVPVKERHNRDQDRLQRIRDNFIWFYSNYEHLKKIQKHQFVAIKDKKQIDNDNDLDRLIRRLGLENYDDAIVIEFIYDRCYL